MEGNILYEKNMSYENVKAVYDISRKAKLPIIYEGTNYQWLDREGFDGDGYITYIVENLKDTAVFLDECELKEIQANKFSALINENTDYKMVEEALADVFDFMNHGDGIIEAVPKGTSKATGIAWLCEHLGIAIEDTYAIGDSINDLEMLEFAGHSIAMGNASEAAKEKAEYVTTHIHDDGIYNALKYYALI
jgi:Cof subfamily protein (haloacid dehalogenase superfamily)